MKRIIFIFVPLFCMTLLSSEVDNCDYERGKHDAYERMKTDENSLLKEYTRELNGNLYINMAVSSCCLLGIPLISSGSNIIYVVPSIISFSSIISELQLERMILIIPIVAVPIMNMYLSKKNNNNIDENSFIKRAIKTEITKDTTKSWAYKEGYMMGVSEYLYDKNMEDR